MTGKSIGILGDGGWGTALAIHLAGAGHRVRVWCAFADYAHELSRTRENKKYLPGFHLRKSIAFATDAAAVVAESEIIVCAIPTQFIRRAFVKIGKVPEKGKIFVNVAKGIENETLQLPTQILRGFIRTAPIAVLSGPSHAEEVAAGKPTCVVIAHQDPKVSRLLQAVFTSKLFRVYTSKDVVGVQVGGAVKNVIAIAGGIVDGLAYGDNTKAALLARGIAEITKLGAQMGAKRETFFGLSGLGDLVTTCISPHGRNRAVGEQLGKGRSLKQILGKMTMVAEGVATAKSVHQLASKYKIEMPIAQEVYKVLFQNKSPKKALFDLMMRAPKAEA